jgi:FkbM family methyltransferase
MRAAAYLRATPSELGFKQEVLERQRARVEQHIAEHGWELVAVYEDVPRPDGFGAPPALLAMLNDLERFDRLVIPKLRTLMPDIRALLDILRQLRRAGVGLVSLHERFDTAAESGVAVPYVLWFAAEREKARQANAGWQPESLRKPGFDPATVIDVGVATGTPALYQAFPEAHLVLIDPLEEYLPYFEHLQRERGAEYVVLAVGAEKGSATIEVDREGPIFSSMLPRVPTPPPGQLEARDVQVATLDSLLEERRWQGPFGLKLDVEGYEHHVIAGAGRLLADTQFVISEVSLMKRFENSYTFAEFIAIMDSHGFRMCDVLDPSKAAPFREPRYANVMFRRDSSS